MVTRIDNPFDRERLVCVISVNSDHLCPAQLAQFYEAGKIPLNNTPLGRENTMKIVTLAITAVLFAGPVAQAYPYQDGYGRGHYGRGGWHHHDGVAVGVACAPEVLEGNVAATDRTLATLSASPDFATATTFKAQVQRIAAIKAPDQRASEYFKLIGVDASNKEAVVEFMGARDVSSAQVVELQRSTQLSDAQANKVASTLQTALRGNLQ
jgi:hypothetical protein